MLSFLKNYRFEILLFVFYTLLAIIITYPLIFNLSNSVYSISERLIDGLADIYDLWWWKRTFLHGGDPNFIPHLGLNGVRLVRTVPYSLLFIKGVERLLVIFLNPVAVFNILILSSFPLAGLATYLLAFYLTKDRLASALAGFIYAFAPLHRRYAFEWLGMSQWHWLPLYVLSLLKLDQTKSAKWGLLTGLLFSITFIENYYFGYFVIFLTIFFVFFRALQMYLAKRRLYPDRQRLCSYLLALAAVAVLTLPITLTFVKETSHLTASGEAAIPGFVHSEWERFAFSARPWFYLLPDILHPVFGNYVKEIYAWIAQHPPYFITKPFYPREHTLYLGWTTLILSAVAVIKGLALKTPSRSVKASKRQSVNERLTINGLRFTNYVFLFLFLGIVMMILSAPPYITVNLHRIYFPSYFLAKVFPMFRSYARCGVLVLLCFSILAALGFKFLLEKVKSRRGKLLLTLFAFCFLNFEFLNFPPFRNEDIGPSPAHKWVAKQPGDFAVAEWLVVNNLPLIRQRYHGKRLINPLRWAPKEVVESMKAVDTPETAQKLKAWGVYYLLVHTRTPKLFEKLPWYRLVAAFPKDVFYVFEVAPNEKTPL